MLDAMLHRGPDDRGIYTFNGTVLGHTRLSIVDVAGGHQPILANGGSTGIICNTSVTSYLNVSTAFRMSFRGPTNVCRR